MMINKTKPSVYWGGSHDMDFKKEISNPLGYVFGSIDITFLYSHFLQYHVLIHSTTSNRTITCNSERMTIDSKIW